MRASISSVSAMGRLFHWPRRRSLSSGSTSTGTMPRTLEMMAAVWRVRMSEPAMMMPMRRFMRSICLARRYAWSQPRSIIGRSRSPPQRNPRKLGSVIPWRTK